jgi:hypothetical protein
MPDGPAGKDPPLSIPVEFRFMHSGVDTCKSAIFTVDGAPEKGIFTANHPRPARLRALYVSNLELHCRLALEVPEYGEGGKDEDFQ